jgi:probable F420-dependent oxidoreductase
MQIGIGVLVVPLRNALVLGAQLATLDVLSGGNVLLGVGTGWMQEEFAAAGRVEEYRTRGALLDESIAVMRSLWGEQPASFAGEWFHFEDVYCEPVPLQKGGPPIWVGGDTERSLRRVARLGNGWQPQDLDPAIFRAKCRHLDDLLIEAGRSPTEVVRSVSAVLPITGRSDKRAAEAAEAYAQAGCEHLVVYSGNHVQFDKSIHENIERAIMLFEAITPYR